VLLEFFFFFGKTNRWNYFVNYFVIYAGFEEKKIENIKKTNINSK